MITVSASAQDSLNVRKVGELHDYWRYALDADERDGYSYLATIDGLFIYEATSSETMSKVGVYGHKSYQAIKIAENYAYVISQENSLQGNFVIVKMEILDLSVPESPVMLNTITIESSCVLGANGSEIKEWLVGDNIYYSSVSGIIKKLDVSNPNDVSVEIVPLDNAQVINISGNCDNVIISSLTHIDVYNAENFVLIGHYEVGGEFNDVCVSGNFVYGVKQEDPTILHIYDVSVPSSTVEISSYDLLQRTDDIDVINNVLFGVMKDPLGENPDYLRPIDITDPYNPTAKNDIPLGNFCVVSSRSANSSDNIISFVGIKIINLGQDQCYGRNAFLRCDITDLENPAGLAMVESDLFRGFKELQVNNNVAYYKRKTLYYMTDDFCDQWDLVITDISNPSNPEELASLYIEENDFVIDNILYHLNHEGQLRARDLSDPNNPEDLYVYSHEMLNGREMKIMDNLFVVAGRLEENDYYVALYDVSDRNSEPQYRGYLHGLNVYASPVGLMGNSMILLGDNKIYEVDISNPELPQLLTESELETDDIIESVIYEDSIFILSTYGEDYSRWEIREIDISNMSQPQLVNDCLSLIKINDMEISGNHLYITQEQYGISIFDINDLSRFYKMGYYRAGSLGSSIAVKDNMLYTVGQRLSVYDCTDALGADEINLSDVPEEYNLFNAYPNPFNPTLNVKVSLPEKGQLRLSVFNVLGREVAVLADQSYSKGIFNFTFDGSEMSSGIYFIKAVVDGKMNQVQKVMLMK